MRMATQCHLGSKGGLKIEDQGLMMTTHCRLGSQGGLFRTASRSGLGGGFPQREQRLDHVGPVNEDCEDQEDNVKFMTRQPLSAEGRSEFSPSAERTGTHAASKPPKGCLQSSEQIPSLKSLILDKSL